MLIKKYVEVLQILPLLILMAAGWAVGSFLGVDFIFSEQSQSYYQLLSYILLAVGLYGAVYGIDKKDFGEHFKTILSAITIGVVLKSIIIGSIFYIVTGNVLGFLLGILIAQIDPVSVAHLLGAGKKRLSKSAQSVLRSWSSFDDPMTVLLLIYLGVPFLSAFIDTSSFQFNVLDYFFESLLNLGFALLMYILHKLFSYNSKSEIPDYILLAISFVFCIYFQWMLAISIIGLIIRPNFEKVIEKVITIAFYVVTFMIGTLLIKNIFLFGGLLLALATVISQVIATIILIRTFPKKDKIYLAFSHQSGITAILLALILEASFSGVVGVVAPAIIFINLFYYISNATIDNYLD